jgi:hypothetical protein
VSRVERGIGIAIVVLVACLNILLFHLLHSTNQGNPDMPRTKSTEVYEVTIPTARKPIYVEAQGKQEARAIALKNVTVEKLSGREVRDLIAAGTAIIDGSDVKVVEDPTTAGQQSLPVEPE